MSAAAGEQAGALRLSRRPDPAGEDDVAAVVGVGPPAAGGLAGCWFAKRSGNGNLVG